MTTTSTTFREFAQFVMNNRDDALCNDVIALCDDKNDIDDVIASLHHYAHSMTLRVAKYLKTFASFDANDEFIIYDVEQFNIVRALTQLISNEYENIDNDDEHELSLWNTFALQGDDDVDYSSSYIEFLCDFIQCYENAQNDKTTQ